MARIEITLEFPGGIRLQRRTIELLESIERLGSISDAAREQRLSYRGAWQKVADATGAVGRPMVAAVSGGRDGGGTRLTTFGRIVVDNYRDIERRSEIASSVALANLDRLQG